ncbi:SusC/RagA family TonB-linked outer membrane protein [Pedobacter hiemivivus]|uniref:SusC/RagA family TonB-linked outer membrane protein n=2 Tax=Pedobacter hiemivivus TaxID=2530454 RepID=A0A4R0NI85_9SPHI|nr:SusC/RagA family TonB-linked outer membrane protein [Pedobacter hiemivivus]
MNKLLKYCRSILYLSGKYGLILMGPVLFFVSFLHASTIREQQFTNGEITIAIKRNSSVKDVFNQMQKISGFEFLYDPVTVNENRNLPAMSFSKTKITVVLEKLGFEVEVNGKFLVLKEARVAKKTVDIVVRGVVTDSIGGPIPGVGVEIVGTILATVTDKEGKYSITLSDNKQVLLFSMIGFKAQQIAYQGNKIVNVVLREENSTLSEVVVVAFGTQKKISVTGALTTVKGEELAKSPTLNLAQSLVGRTSGVFVEQTTGAPGNEPIKIRIRGSSTNALNSEPLVLVDGIERPFNSINAEEVENITVLKDASTTAVYGIRGANGVILVSTKRGTTGKPKIGFTSNFALQTPTRLPEFSNSYDYAFLYNEGMKNDTPTATPDNLYYKPADLQKFKDGSDPLLHPNINWFDYMLHKTAPQTKNTLTINGGGTFAKYFVSLGYVNQSGLLKEFNKNYGYSNNTTYNRYNFRSNVDFNLTKTTIFKLSLGGYADKYHTAGSPFSTMLRAGAGASPGVIGDKIIQSYINPITGISGGYDERFINQFNITADLNQKLDMVTKGLSFRAKLGYDSDYTTSMGKNVTRPTYEILETVVDGKETVVYLPSTDELVGGVTAQSFSSRSKRIYLEAALQYDKSFGKHNVTGLVLYNQNKQFWPFSASYATQYPEVAIGYLGIVGRITYNYDYRYMLEGSIGRNGSENFPAEKRYGTFPAISAGWNVTREPLVKKLLGDHSVLSLLKFRASYGETGNDKLIAINPLTGKPEYYRFMYLPTVYEILANRARFGEDIRGVEGVVEGQTGNPNITWEKAVKQNYGIETTFFNDKLSFNADYFIDYRNNILATKPVIGHVAAAIQDVYNLAKVRNQGYELQVGWNSKIGGLKYSLSGNFTYAHNKLLENGMPETAQNQFGHSISQTYGLIALGFFNTQAEADAAPLQYSAKPTPGDVKYLDSNKDGKVDKDDFVPIGSPTYPEKIYGATLDLSYKGFDFSVLFQGAGRVSRLVSGYMQKPGNQFGGILANVMEQRWTPENAANAKLPKLSATYANGTNYQNSTLWIRDASYLRLKNIELGYRFSSNDFFKKVGVSSARVYVSGQNLLTWDKLKLVDPEQNASDSMGYPQLQVFNAGLSVQF